MKRAFLLVLVLFVVAAFMGCVRDDDVLDPAENNAAAGIPLSEEEFLAQGNAICAEGTKAINAAADDLGSGQPTDEEAEAFLEDVLLPNIQGQLDALGALEPPEDLAADVYELLAEAEAALESMKEQGIKVFDSKKDPFAEVNKLAEALGLEKCAE